MEIIGKPSTTLTKSMQCLAASLTSHQSVFECGFSEDASSSSVETGDFADPPQSSGQGDQSSDVELEKDFEKNLQRNSKPSKKANKDKTPVTTKKRKALPSETSESNLVDFLEMS